MSDEFTIFGHPMVLTSSSAWHRLFFDTPHSLHPADVFDPGRRHNMEELHRAVAAAVEVAVVAVAGAGAVVVRRRRRR